MPRNIKIACYKICNYEKIILKLFILNHVWCQLDSKSHLE